MTKSTIITCPTCGQRLSVVEKVEGTRPGMIFTDGDVAVSWPTLHVVSMVVRCHAGHVFRPEGDDPECITRLIPVDTV